MKKLLTIAAIGLMLPMVGTAAPKPRFTVIHMTKNYNTSLFPAECLGTVTTETLPSMKGDHLTWVIKNGNGHNSSDRCASFDPSKVELHFKDDVMGTAAMRVLKAKSSSGSTFTVEGDVDSGIAKGAHKYMVFYKTMQAGPDPEIEVDCGGCGGR